MSPTRVVVRPLLTGLVDDAGLFPPESLEMAAAVARHREDAADAHPVLTHRFLCPAARLDELREVLAPDETLSLGLITVLDPGRVSHDIAVVDGTPALRLAAVEGTLPEGEGVAAATRLALTSLEALPPEVASFVELPVRGDWAAGLPVLAGTTTGAKVRCGGETADLFPTVEELAAVVSACVAAAVPFKATAGLHSAVRHVDDQTGFPHHGFLNLLVAVCRAAEGGSEAEVAEALAATDADRLVEESAGIGDSTAEAARGAFVSYGSCSTGEPIEDLERLGLLASGR